MSESRGQSLWPFVLGFLAGAAVGLLLAPEKGEESRKKLRRKADELKKQYGETVDEVKEKVEPVLTKVGQTVSPVFKRIEEVEDLAKEELAEALGEEAPLATFDTRSPDFSPQVTSPEVKIHPAKRLFFRNTH